MFAGMRTGSVHKPALLFAALLTACGGPGGEEKRGAPSPEALLDKLFSGLDELHPERVASCFDQSTSDGKAIAELVRKTVDILKQGRALESTVRAKFGNGYADEHVAIKAPALFVEGLRKRLGEVRLRVEGSVEYKQGRFYEEDAEKNPPDNKPPPSMYARYKVWYLAVPTLLVNDLRLQREAGQVLDIFGRHLERAADAVTTSGTEQEFRARMSALGKETRARCAPLLDYVVQAFRRL